MLRNDEDPTSHSTHFSTSIHQQSNAFKYVIVFSKALHRNYIYWWNWVPDTLLKGAPTVVMTFKYYIFTLTTQYFTKRIIGLFKPVFCQLHNCIFGMKLSFFFIGSGKGKTLPVCSMGLSHWGIQPGTSVNETEAFWLPRKLPRITTTSVITVIWLNPIIALPESRQHDLCSAANSPLIWHQWILYH